MHIDDDVRWDLRVGTWGAALFGGAIIVGVLVYGQLLLALVGLLTLLVTIPVVRVVYAGVIHPVTSTAARIVARAAGEDYMPDRVPPAASHRSGDLPTSGKAPEYTIVTRCGCGAAVEVNDSVPRDTQRAMLEPFFTVHEPCMARALDEEPGAEPMISTITCCCGQQLTVDLVHTERAELARLHALGRMRHRHRLLVVSNGPGIAFAELSTPEHMPLLHYSMPLLAGLQEHPKELVHLGRPEVPREVRHRFGEVVVASR